MATMDKKSIMFWEDLWTCEKLELSIENVKDKMLDSEDDIQQITAWSKEQKGQMKQFLEARFSIICLDNMDKLCRQFMKKSDQDGLVHRLYKLHGRTRETCCRIVVKGSVPVVKCAS